MNKISKHIIELLPHWHYGIERTIKQEYSPDSSFAYPVSYEGYFCLLLLDIKGEMTMNDLSQSLRIRKQQASPLIDKLENNGLVLRTTSEKDHRVLYVKLSRKGKEYIANNPFDLSKIIKNISNRLSEDELETLNTALGMLATIFPKFS